MKSLLLSLCLLVPQQTEISDEIITPKPPYDNFYCSLDARSMIPQGPVFCPAGSVGLDQACLEACRNQFVKELRTFLAAACDQYHRMYTQYSANHDMFLDSYLACILGGEPPGVCNGYIVDANTATRDFNNFANQLMMDFEMTLDELSNDYWNCVAMCCIPGDD